MTKKRTFAPHFRRHVLTGLKASLFVSFLLLLVLLRIPPSPYHVSPVRNPLPYSGPPKVSFLFLARTLIPLDFLWHAFLQNEDPDKFSVYVHSSPGIILDASTTRSSFFYGRQLRNSVQVVWGEVSMIEAERLLFRAALEDPANQRFVLLSDSCVPLYNFSYIYGYLMSSSRSFVDSFMNPNDRRYNPKMSPLISKEKWRKGSQWITVVRKHVEVIVADHTAFSTFKKHCKLLDQEPYCIPDEHYVQTLFSIAGLENELERRTLTYTSWNQTANKMEKQSWHPLTFDYSLASPQHINEIKNTNHVYYETEYRTEWCQSNATAVPCFLFARKFTKGAALRLLRDGLFGPFDPTAEFLWSS